MHKLSYRIKWPNSHGPYFYYTNISLPACTYGIMGSSLWPAGGGREDSGLVYNWFSMIGRHHLKVDSCNITAPFWDFPEGQWWPNIFPAGRTSGSLPGCHAFLEEEMVRRVIITCFTGCGQCFGWTVRDLEETRLENWWQENLGKSYVNNPLWRMKTFVSSVNILQRVSSAGVDSNNQVDIAWPIPWDSHSI